MCFFSCPFGAAAGFVSAGFVSNINFQRAREMRTDAIIFKIFSPKNLAKISPFLSQTTASFYKNLTVTLFLRKLLFFAENWQNRRKL
jgi:hypothetical protein